MSDSWVSCWRRVMQRASAEAPLWPTAGSERLWGMNPVADRNDSAQVVVQDPSGELSGAFPSNVQEILASCLSSPSSDAFYKGRPMFRCDVPNSSAICACVAHAVSPPNGSADGSVDSSCLTAR